MNKKEIWFFNLYLIPLKDFIFQKLEEKYKKMKIKGKKVEKK